MQRRFLSSLAALSLLFSGCVHQASMVTTINPATHVTEAGPKKAQRPETETLGPDVIVSLSAEEVWPIISNVEDWGSWCPSVTKVEPGAGLSPGAEVKWQWEEKEVDSVIVAVTENEEFDFKSCASSKKAEIHWRLRQRPDGSTLVSLRAVVPYGTASETMSKLGMELNTWITSLQAAANKE
jgi:hypothetical protein